MDRKAGDDPVPRVGRPDRHPVTLAHTESCEGSGGAADFIMQFGEGEAAVIGDEGEVVGEVERHPVEHGGRGQWWWHAGRPLTKQVLGR